VSLIERDPEVISSDVDIAAKVGQDLFLDEKIPITRIRSGICEDCGTLGTIEGKGSL
jgi:hypothetical protein